MDLVYKNSILGGTFDHLHLGHQKLIDTAFEMSDHVTIGLTKSEMYKDKYLANSIENYETREKNLKLYLLKKGYLEKTTIIPIVDIYGTTLKEKNIDAIFATEENLGNLTLINKKREEVGFSPLKTFIVPFVKGNDGKIISSERIRKGEIDRDGFVYVNVFKNTIQLSESVREKLHRPIGSIVENTEEVLKLLNDEKIVIAVGDIVVNALKEKGCTPALAIIDFKTRRKIIENLIMPDGERVINDPGTINALAAHEIYEKINKYLETSEPQMIIVDGEEDLLALPAVLLAPLGSVVLYGQFDQGIVVNDVTEELKRTVKKFIE